MDTRELYQSLLSQLDESPFALGQRAAKQGLPWTSCPFNGYSEIFEQREWMRGWDLQVLRTLKPSNDYPGSTVQAEGGQ